MMNILVSVAKSEGDAGEDDHVILTVKCFAAIIGGVAATAMVLYLIKRYQK